MNNSISRPRSVTVISWILIIFGTLGLFALFAAGSALGSMAVWGIIGVAVSIVCGVAMLVGQNWGRLVYIIFTPVSFLIEGFGMGFAASQLVQVALYAVIVYFLIQGKASEFFGGPLFGGRSSTTSS